MDNVYNRSLFRAKGRDARNKLARMGGIMASSTELMEAAMPPQPAPMPAPQPMMMPQPLALVQQPMPAMPAPRPMAPMPAPQPPIKMANGGDPSLYDEYRNALSKSHSNPMPTAVDVGQDPLAFIQGLKSEAAKLQPEGGVQAVESAVATLQAANATGDQETIKDAITGSVGVENTKAGLEAAAVGLTGASPKEAESLSIDELNNRIMAVAMNGSLAAPGSMAERYAKAMIFGLSQKRDTALARAAAKAGGSGVSPLEPFPDAVRDLAGKLVQARGLDLDEAMVQAEAALRPLYQGQGGAPTAAPASAKPTLGEFLEKAQAVNPNATVEELTAYYTQNYGG